MFLYYVRLAHRSLRRNVGLTIVMIIAIALGIGAAMTTLTSYRVLSGNPLPQKSDRLFYLQLDPRPAAGSAGDPEPPDQLTRFDAEQLLRDRKGQRQAVMTAGSVTVYPQGSITRPTNSSARYTSADFFPMFDVPLAHGRFWTREDDDGRARVAVVSQAFVDKVFAGANPVGRTVQFNKTPFTVIGVMGNFSPKPRFYDMTTSRYSDVESIFIPFSTALDLDMDTQGGMNCWGRPPESGPRGPNAPCAWLQYWVELQSPSDAVAYKAYLDNYSRAQKQAGRFEKDPNVRLHDLMGWMDYRKVVPGDVKLQMWLASGFLLVCLLNTVGLLLAKFMRRSGEYGVRRALGASRRDIFIQCLIEAGMVGLLGGIIGLLLSLFGLWLIRQQPDDYAQLAQMDWVMLATTFAFAIATSLLAGALPAWRASRIVPAIQLKTQ